MEDVKKALEAAFDILDSANATNEDSKVYSQIVTVLNELQDTINSL